MLFSKADGISTGVTLVLTAIGYWVGGPTTAIICFVVGVLILLGIHFLTGKSKGDIFLYVVAALAYLPVLVTAVTGHSILYRPEAQFTPDNVEVYLKDWLKQIGYGYSDVGQQSTQTRTLCFRFAPHLTAIPCELRGCDPMEAHT